MGLQLDGMLTKSFFVWQHPVKLRVDIGHVSQYMTLIYKCFIMGLIIFITDKTSQA